MKITIEIDDKALRDAVNAQVGAKLAEWTGKALEEKANEIIGAKLSRFDIDDFVANRMDRTLPAIVEETLTQTLGIPQERKAKITAIVKEEIAARVKSAFKAEFAHE